MQYYLFTVNSTSWNEHINTGIAAINNPASDSENRQGNSKKQAAMCELIGIKKGDCLFFYLQGEKKIMGLFKSNSEPFFDDCKLLGKSSFINEKYSLRLEFKIKKFYENTLDMDEIWKLKDKGNFWSIQQQRGDAIGRHACLTLTKHDGEKLIKMFNEKNPIDLKKTDITIKNHKNTPLNFDLTYYDDMLHYEAALQGLILSDLKKGRHKEVFGDYDYYIPFFPTSSQREIDILVLKHNNQNEVLWYQIIELKQNQFSLIELNKLMLYEQWVINTLAYSNERAVHAIGIANNFSDEVIDYIKGREVYGLKKIRLIKYSYNYKNKSLKFEQIY